MGEERKENSLETKALAVSFQESKEKGKELGQNQHASLVLNLHFSPRSNLTLS